jgi:hypothetical protein
MILPGGISNTESSIAAELRPPSSTSEVTPSIGESKAYIIIIKKKKIAFNSLQIASLADPNSTEFSHSNFMYRYTVRNYASV